MQIMHVQKIWPHVILLPEKDLKCFGEVFVGETSKEKAFDINVTAAKTMRTKIVLLQSHEYKIFQQISKKKRKKEEKSSCSPQQNRFFKGEISSF